MELQSEACDIVSLVQNAATSFGIYAQSKGIQVTCSCPEGDVPMVMLDKIRLRQAGMGRGSFCAWRA